MGMYVYNPDTRKHREEDHSPKPALSKDVRLYQNSKEKKDWEHDSSGTVC
jgi:hypothetical protein